MNFHSICWRNCLKMALKTSGQALIAIALFCATIIFVVVQTNNQNAVFLERIAKLESGSGANPKIAAPVAAKSNLASTPGLGAPLKKCILDATTDMWDDFVSIVRTCVKEHNAPLRDMATTFEAFHMGRYEEKKYFFPLADPSASCNWLTIGVGGDSQVEKEFKQKYPQCNVFGIEPSDDQKSDFEKYGTIIPHAVGGFEIFKRTYMKSENFRHFVRYGNNSSTRWYIVRVQRCANCSTSYYSWGESIDWLINQFINNFRTILKLWLSTTVRLILKDLSILYSKECWMVGFSKVDFNWLIDQSINKWILQRLV